MPKKGSGKRCNVIGFKYRDELLHAIPEAEKKFGQDNIDYAYADQINNLKISCQNKSAWTKSRTYEKKLREKYSIWG